MVVTIWTIGHSTHSSDELIALLKEHQLESLVDIRAFPSSARNPQFNRQNLGQRLSEEGLIYHWLGKELGGYRKKTGPNSSHIALVSPGFRDYADHMASEDFLRGVLELEVLAAQKRLAVMCAEKLWWRCHRSLLSDYLVACRGVEVLHIVGQGAVERHRLHRAARIAEGRLIYDLGEPMKLL